METKLLRYKEIGVTDKQREDYVKYQEKEQADAETAKQRAETERHNRADEEIKAEAIKEADAKGDIAGAATLLRSINEDPSQLSKRAKSYQATIDEADLRKWKKRTSLRYCSGKHGLQVRKPEVYPRYDEHD